MKLPLLPKVNLRFFEYNGLRLECVNQKKWEQVRNERINFEIKFRPGDYTVEQLLTLRLNFKVIYIDGDGPFRVVSQCSLVLDEPSTWSFWAEALIGDESQLEELRYLARQRRQA